MSGHWESGLPVHWLGSVCTQVAHQQGTAFFQAPGLPRGTQLTRLSLRLKAKTLSQVSWGFTRKKELKN